MSEPTGSVEEKRERELFRLLKESLDEAGDAAVPETIKFLAVGCDQLDYLQIGMEDGFINYLYRIAEKPPGKRSVVVKWTRNIARIAEKEDIEMKLDETFLQRNTKESEALQRIEKIVPGSTPKIYWVDSKRYFFLMEDLADYVTLRQQLIDNVVEPEVFKTISIALATLHKATHIKTIGKEAFDKLTADIYNRALIEQVGEAFFEKCFMRNNDMAVISHERQFTDSMKKLLPELYDNAEITEALKPLKESFLNILACCVHNDTHPGSFMVNPGNNVRMLDLEIFSVGNPAKEIGYTLGEIIMFYYAYKGRGNMELARKLKGVVKQFVLSYLSIMGSLINDEGEFMQYLAGHAGQFGCFRTANLVLVFPPLEGLEEEEAECLSAVIRLLKEMHEITTLDKFISVAFNE